MLAQACHELEITRIKEHYWRKARRHASLAALFLFPLLAALLVGSFSYLTRAQVSGLSSVLIVGVLGGLLGGVLVCVRWLATRVRRRVGPPAWPEWRVWSMLVAPLAFGGRIALRRQLEIAIAASCVYFVLVGAGALVAALLLLDSTRSDDLTQVAALSLAGGALGATVRARSTR